MENKKLWLFGISLFLIVGVTAVWISSIRLTTNYNIISDPFTGITITESLSDQTFDSLSGEIHFSENITIYNEDIQREIIINVKTNKTDIGDECYNWENDCSMKYYLNSQRLNETDNTVRIDNGNNNLEFNIECERYSCPQIVTPEIEITPLAN